MKSKTKIFIIGAIVLMMLGIPSVNASILGNATPRICYRPDFISQETFTLNGIGYFILYYANGDVYMVMWNVFTGEIIYAGYMYGIISPCYPVIYSFIPCYKQVCIKE